MNKLIAILFVLSLLFAFTACEGEEDSVTDSSLTTETAKNSGDDTEIPPGTETDHNHIYDSEITVEPSCEDEGIRTFTCTCGDSYTEAIPAQHTFGEWEIKSVAMVGRNGSETRTCTLCEESESRERTANAIANSFYDEGLVYFGRTDACQLNGPALVNYALHTFPQFRDTAVKSKTLFGALMDRFPVTDQMIDNAKYWGAMTGLYNEADDTFQITYTRSEIEDGNLTILGYVHQGGNEYAVYYQCFSGIEDRYCEFVVEYNRLNGESNYYVSSRVVSELPDDMVKCADGEQIETN